MIIKDVYSFSSEAIAKAMENVFEISRLGAYLGKNHITLSDALSICPLLSWQRMALSSIWIRRSACPSTRLRE